MLTISHEAAEQHGQGVGGHAESEGGQHQQDKVALQRHHEVRQEVLHNQLQEDQRNFYNRLAKEISRSAIFKKNARN